MLKGDKVILRPLQKSDWKSSIGWRNDTEIKQQAMLHPYPITDMNEEQWYEEMLQTKSNKQVYFTITTISGQPIGYISLQNINYIHRNCYLGIVIGEKEARGKGFGEDSMKLIIDYAFNTLNLQ
ncbi:MAG: GNAT family N-acetyltransferase, partial [bacterium]